MTPPQSEIFKAYKDYFEEKFSHFETKIDNVASQTDKILEQVAVANGRVTKLENWKSEVGGITSGITKTTLFFGAVIGAMISAVVQYFWGR